MTLELTFKVNEFCGPPLQIALMKAHKQKIDCSNQTILVRVICLFVLFLADDLEIDLQGQ
jgi:hypothetical protein